MIRIEPEIVSHFAFLDNSYPKPFESKGLIFPDTWSLLWSFKANLLAEQLINESSSEIARKDIEKRASDCRELISSYKAKGLLFDEILEDSFTVSKDFEYKWDKIKGKALRICLEKSYDRNPFLAYRLIATGNEEIVYQPLTGITEIAISKSKDIYEKELTYWGKNGLLGIGENALGSCLMELREKYGRKYKTKVLSRHINSYQQNNSFVYIGRGTPWGNPYSIDSNPKDTKGTKILKRDRVVLQYLDFLSNSESLQKRVKEELKGKNLLCSCSPFNCHGFILASLAETGRIPEYI